MKRKRLICCLCVMALLLGSTVCYASGWKEYCTTVAPINGSGYSGYITAKEYGIYVTWLDSIDVSGNYTVDARPQGYVNSKYRGLGPWIQKVTDQKMYCYATFYQSTFTNDYVYKKSRMQFSNDLTTPVYVQVTGEFALSE